MPVVLAGALAHLRAFPGVRPFLAFLVWFISIRYQHYNVLYFSIYPGLSSPSRIERWLVVCYTCPHLMHLARVIWNRKWHRTIDWFWVSFGMKHIITQCFVLFLDFTFEHVRCSPFSLLTLPLNSHSTIRLFVDLNFCTNWWWLGLRISVHLFGFLSITFLGPSCVARHETLHQCSSYLILISPVLIHVLCRVSILTDTLTSTNRNNTMLSD